ncbi:MAG TPA: hypothetical protein VHI13_08795, partial [Candidatus Kapabacteria bacterium]|nr:hypothetical protein [Candidatus Kapabacteria bacterium]
MAEFIVSLLKPADGASLLDAILPNHPREEYDADQTTDLTPKEWTLRSVFFTRRCSMNKRYSDEFKAEALRLSDSRETTVRDVA